jgi:hypothetical protein
MAYPRPNQDYLLSPDWAENGRSFDIRYYWDSLEPQVVVLGYGGFPEQVPLSKAVQKGSVSEKTAGYALAVNHLISKAFPQRSHQMGGKNLYQGQVDKRKS